MKTSTWRGPKKSDIMTADEIRRVVLDLKRPDASLYRQQNLVIFRLAAGCALRRQEIADCLVCNVIVEGPYPTLTVPRGKGGLRRTVPLWWDENTRYDLADWKYYRADDPNGPFVLSQKSERKRHLDPKTIARRWRTAIKCLGPDRVRQLNIHAGRHTFISHALAAGRSLKEVADAVGHVNIATTNCYTHLIETKDMPNLFEFEQPRGIHLQRTA